MATLYITEYLAGPRIGAQIAGPVPLVNQTVAIGGSSVQSSAFSKDTGIIRVHSDAICSILVGPNPTAVTTTARMAADQTEYFSVNQGDKIAVISNT